MRPGPGRLAVAVLALAVGLALVNELRPVAAVEATQRFPPALPGAPGPTPPWPPGAQAAIGAEGAGVIAATPDARPEPIASVAKVMTALVTLQARPLRPGESGPVITVSAADQSEYERDQAQGQSVVPVQVGEQLTEYQALQALLIPSGNNIADLLARWALGSVQACVRRMNAEARSLGLRRTTFADVSGFSPRTRSVPADLVRLGEVAMRNPVIADVVAQGQADLPLAGTVVNVNYLLFQDGIIGIKTGNIPEVGAVYLVAARGLLADGRSRLLFGAVQGLPTIEAALQAGRELIDAMKSLLVVRHLVSAGQPVGDYRAPWGEVVGVAAVEDLDVLTWPGSPVRARLAARPLEPPVSPRTEVGDLEVTVGAQTYDLPVAVTGQLYGPGRLARLTRLTW
jgi:D-alanyl-D-alanine carboxypeptidase (penicillin-binding protein 5/6)